MILKGKAKRIKREVHPCPDDGIHRKGKDGSIKGTKSIWIDRMLCPRGSVGLYYNHAGTRGMKVYLGLPTGKKPWISKRGVVKKALKTMQTFYEAGFSPEPFGMEQIKVELKLDGRTIKEKPWVLRMQHVYYDERKWYDYACGKPYRWGSEPDHCPAGYLRFVERLKAFQKKHRIGLSAASWKNDENAKLGDVIYCLETERWYIVDCD